MKNGEIKVKEVAYHRNGIAGEGFNVVTFDHKIQGEKSKRQMVGVLFEGSGRCAVFDVNELQKGNIAFACGNSWRGDNFEPDLRKAIEKYDNGWRETVGLSPKETMPK